MPFGGDLAIEKWRI